MTLNKDTYIDQLIRITCLAAITYVSFRLLLPFFGILAWGFILAVAQYPMYLWLNSKIGNRPILSASIITTMSLVILVGTIIFLTNNTIASLAHLTGNIRSNQDLILLPSKAVEKWPLIGGYLYDAWFSLSSNLSELLKYSNYLLLGGSFVVKKMALQGLDFILFIFSVIFAGYLMTQANHYMRFARKFAQRISPNQGAQLIHTIKKTIQNVSRGVIGIAILQALIFGLLLLIANVPGAGLICLLGLILCIIQVGLFILIVPIIAWLLFTKSLPFAIAISILMLLVTLIDNVLKPIVLAHGLKTPMLVILFGVLGGIISFGLVGIFIGPIVLAVFYDLAYHWCEPSVITS